MIINLTLQSSDPNILGSTFDESLSPILTEYLKNDCILDQAGVSRVIPLLRSSYIQGMKNVFMTFNPHMDELGELDSEGKPLQERIDTTRERMIAMCKHINDTLIASQMAMLYSVALTLAANDERIYKRPRH